MARNLVLGAGLFLLAATALPAAESAAARVADAERAPLFSTRGGRVSMEVRERLAQLLQLPKDKLWEELMKWPAFHQMTLQEQGDFLNRLAEMRQRIRVQALRKASEMGLKIPPEKEDAFVNSYIEERIAMEKKIWQETQPKRHQLDEEMKSNLKRQYAPGGAPNPAPLPSGPEATSTPTSP